MASSAPPPSSLTYNFPRYKPYDIQLDLMDHLYASISAGHITVIESPTGTGKTLSLLSSTLTWLQDAKQQAKILLVEGVREELKGVMGGEPEWVMQQEIRRRVEEMERGEEEMERRLGEVRRKEGEEKGRMAGGREVKRKKLGHEGEGKGEDEFAPDPYDSEGDGKRVEENEVDNYTPEVRELMRKLSGGSTRSTTEEQEPDVRKIYFASRTHSQLTQFIEELRKTPFAHYTPSDPDTIASTRTHPIRVIPLGARNQLCINEDIKKASGGNSEALNDMCLETQKGGKTQRCKFLPPTTEPAKMNEFRDQALASVRTIGDIEDLGRKLGTCPYYGTRKAVRSAELVTLPYNMLMQKTAREALGISLKEHVVIIDEAHNLIESILSLHTIVITSSMLRSIRSALVTYFTKFKTKFKGSNAAYLKQLLLVMKGLLDFAEGWGKEGGGEKKEAMMGVNEVVQSLKGGALDQVNFLKLDTYLKESQIGRKIGGYVDSLAEEKSVKGRQALRSNATRNLHRLQSFLVSLVNPDADGRVLLSSETTPARPATKESPAVPAKIEVSMKYMLLAPSDSFRDIAEESRSVILAGGTMAPMSDFREQLFPYLAKERFSTFSCDHIVPPEHISTYAVAKGPTGIELKFTFDKRKDLNLIDELGRSITNISQLVPKGVVCFVPSYDFLNQVQTRWQSSGLLARLQGKKKVFWEPTASGDVEATLEMYSAANSGESPGGILFAVVGAKLSEGINFADDMARCVIICGIPYPNSQGTELKERMSYVKSLPRQDRSSGDAGQVLYQNLAFRAVNQSIGRAIRHANDWAAIILLDSRYTQPSKQSQLPKWLSTNVVNPSSFKDLVKSLAAFARTRKLAS